MPSNVRMCVCSRYGNTKKGLVVEQGSFRCCVLSGICPSSVSEACGLFDRKGSAPAACEVRGVTQALRVSISRAGCFDLIGLVRCRPGWSVYPFHLCVSSVAFSERSPLQTRHSQS